MYKHLQSIAAFVAVAETGAFNKAADKLGVRASVVSHHISKLEDYLGATLIYRTTRKISLSEHGRMLFKASHELMGNTHKTLDQIIDAQEEAIGALRVALPSFTPDPRIEAALLSFINIHPNVSISLFHSDQVADLLDEKFDLSIRVGEPPVSSFLTRKLSVAKHILVASPELLIKYGTPKSPNDLDEIPFVFMEGIGGHFTLKRGDQSVEFSIQNSQIQTNNILGARAAARSGVGIANVPLPLCEKDLSNGRLARVLPQWQLPHFTVHAVWPDTSRRSSLTMRLVKHLAASTKLG